MKGSKEDISNESPESDKTIVYQVGKGFPRWR